MSDKSWWRTQKHEWVSSGRLNAHQVSVIRHQTVVSTSKEWYVRVAWVGRWRQSWQVDRSCTSSYVPMCTRQTATTTQDSNRNVYSAYISEPGLKSPPNQNHKPQWRCLWTRVIIRKWDLSRIYGGNAILKIYVLSFLQSEDNLSYDFNLAVSSFQMPGAATKKTRLPILSINGFKWTAWT